MAINSDLPNHTTFEPGGAVDHFDDLLCARCGSKATRSFGEDFDLCERCTVAFRSFLTQSIEESDT